MTKGRWDNCGGKRLTGIYSSYLPIVENLVLQNSNEAIPNANCAMEESADRIGRR